ncbi:MAG: MerR family DNA-binding transcriptional regulator [Gammaproteobacteria bacterium]|nr:MerR family DNA-binding transcriptional regulator [Gammaproteobacteria bacterium]
MPNTTYAISDLAKEFDITTRAIRFYEDQGLLAPERKGRQRVYRERDRVRLKLILRGKRLGFSLSGVKEMFDLYDADPGQEGQIRYLLNMIKERRGALKQQQQDIKMVMCEMDNLEKQALVSLSELQTNEKS